MPFANGLALVRPLANGLTFYSGHLKTARLDPTLPNVVSFYMAFNI